MPRPDITHGNTTQPHPPDTPTTADCFLQTIWQPCITSVSGPLATPLSPAPHTFCCFLLCTRFRSPQKVCTLHTRFFAAKYIVRVLALGAAWLAKGPKISGQSYYSIFHGSSKMYTEPFSLCGTLSENIKVCGTP